MRDREALVGKFWLRVVAGLLLWGLATGGWVEAASRLPIHFFWAANCPHCAEAKPFLAELADRYPQVDIVEYDVWGDRIAFGRLV